MGTVWRNWTRRSYDWYFGMVWTVCHALAIALDIWMVLVLQVASISSRTWAACEAHPHLMVAGMLASVGIAMLVRRYRWMIFFTGIMAGHLFAH